jgi:hypothetical protein
MRARIFLATLALVATVGTGVAASAQGSSTERRFSARIDNEWFPLRPGTTYVYSGAKEGVPARDVVTVTHTTITIEGVPCRVVHDRLYLRGRLAERTSDWYSQDRLGNVWYFGEATAEVDRKGRVASTEGSWRAGGDGARPGILMLAHPRVGKTYRQEFYKGQAEDFARVVGVFRSLVGGGPQAVLTAEWTPLEPGNLDHKLYGRGIGTLVERAVKGPDEHLELQSVRRGT